ncbi:E3 SUMO-protein ligase ZBED1 [Frankliniella fusca]|uniref:E3 SUMO-protein ligase ZBED1 n=1 Tax=Frankliniella fusca TaxID=407009 RepID=A0AAE1HY10_9NEOP|nr:E3 SUMO-protein ligase ZBED1 [Frankliniella fusca]
MTNGGGGTQHGQRGQGDEEEELIVEEEGLSSPTPSTSTAGTSTSGRGGGATPSPGPFSPPASPAPSSSRSPVPPPSPQNHRRSSTGSHHGTLDYFVPDTKSMEKLHMAVAQYIVTCQRPLNTVEKEGFRDMLKCFKPGYQVLTRRALTDKYIPKLAEEMKCLLRKLLSDAEYYSLTSDNWTSEADVPFTSLTAHFIDKEWGSLSGVTLRCRASHVSHTAENLKEFFKEELAYWELQVGGVSAITTDNAEDYRLALENLELPHMRCIGHTLQNGVTDIFNLDIVKTAVHDLKTLMNWISTSKVWAAYEKFVTDNHGRKPLTLPSSSKTRWWTELLQFERLLECHPYMMSFAAQYQRGKELRKIPGPTSMFVIREVVRTLKPVHEICTRLCADKYITASAVLPVLHLLEAGFEDDDDPPEVPLDDNEDNAFDVELIKDQMKPSFLRMFIVKKLRKRYCPHPLDPDELAAMTPQAAAQARIAHRCAVKTHQLLVKCTFFDPRYRKELLPSEETLAKELLSEEFRTSLQGTGEGEEVGAQAPPSQSNSLSSLFAKKRRRVANTDYNGDDSHATFLPPVTPTAKFQEEMVRYGDIPMASMEINLLEWWRERKDAYPILQKLSRKYCCVMASSTPSERLFSVGGNVVTDTRTCLTDEHSETLIFLAANKSFIKK